MPADEFSMALLAATGGVCASAAAAASWANSRASARWVTLLAATGAVIACATTLGGFFALGDALEPATVKKLCVKAGSLELGAAAWRDLA